MRMAIAHPPQLGRAEARFAAAPNRNAAGAGQLSAQELVAEWNDPATHHALVAQLEKEYEGWAIATSPESLAVYLPVCPPEARVLVWHKSNSTWSQSHLASHWEPVIVRIPESRFRHFAGVPMSDVLTDGVTYKRPFGDSKPDAWTDWVLAALGFQAGEDQVHTLLAGAGSNNFASSVYQQPQGQRCEFCGSSLERTATGRPRRTCSDACRAQLSRRSRRRKSISS